MYQPMITDLVQAEFSFCEAEMIGSRDLPQFVSHPPIFHLLSYRILIFHRVFKHLESVVKATEVTTAQCSSLMMYRIHQTTDYAYKLSYLAGVANYNLHTAGCRRKDCNILNLILIVNCKY